MRDPPFWKTSRTVSWKNYNDLTATSLEWWLGRDKYPKIALIQDSELSEFTQMYVHFCFFDLDHVQTSLRVHANVWLNYTIWNKLVHVSGLEPSLSSLNHACQKPKGKTCSIAIITINGNDLIF